MIISGLAKIFRANLRHFLAEVWAFFKKLFVKKIRRKKCGNPDEKTKDKNDLTPSKRLQRCFFLVRILRKNDLGLTKNEILSEYHKKNIALPSDRTFERDIDELRKLGYEISCGKNYRYKLEKRKRK